MPSASAFGRAEPPEPVPEPGETVPGVVTGPPVPPVIVVPAPGTVMPPAGAPVTEPDEPAAGLVPPEDASSPPRSCSKGLRTGPERRRSAGTGSLTVTAGSAGSAAARAPAGAAISR